MARMVDLPHPEGPTRETKAPRPMAKVTSSTAVNGHSPGVAKRLVTPRRAMVGVRPMVPSSSLSTA